METKVEYEVQRDPEEPMGIKQAADALARDLDVLFPKLEHKPEDVNLSGLAYALLDWEQKKRELDELEKAIKEAVLILGKTQTVGNVRATFSNPRNGYDYETPVRDLLASDDLSEEEKVQLWSLVGDNTRQVVEWRAVCKSADIEPIVTPGTGPGSVSIKLLS